MSALTSYFSDLTSGLALAVRSTAEKGDGVFTTSAIEADTILMTDTPLCWLAARPDEPGNCHACGAFLGSAGMIIGRLAGQDPIALPSCCDDTSPPAANATATTCGADCPRRPPGHPPRLPLGAKELASTGSEQIQLGAQVMARLAAKTGEAAGAAWQLELDALASPSWHEVCRASNDADDDPELPAASMPALRAALVKAGVVSALPGECDVTVWSRVLGAVARNAIWVQVLAPRRYN